MKKRLEDIIRVGRKYNDPEWALHVFGFPLDKHYDALVIAPGWKPTNIIKDENIKVVTTATHSYISGYEVFVEDLCIAWIQISSGASNLIDHLTICADLNFDKLIFVGAVGALKKEIEIGEICTPSFSIAGVYAHTYLQEDIHDFIPFQKVSPSNEQFIDDSIDTAKRVGIDLKKYSVFCTDSIVGEYIHLDFIKSFRTDLIEMETSTFYLLADLIEKPAIALLIVSDNSANGDSLIGKSEGQSKRYNNARSNILPKLIFEIAKRR